MKLRPAQLDSHLARGRLAPAYLVHGDEPLLALEAADAIRAAARGAGHADREVLFAERGFDWGALKHACASQSLFGDRRLVELRLASGRMPAPGAAAIETCLARPNPEVVLFASMPRPEGPGWWKSAWYGAFESAGIVVEVVPLERAALAPWIGERLARQRQRASPEALEFLCAQVEGNLLAARQEITKLAFLEPEGELALEAVRRSVASVARYDFEDLAEALYAGDLARYARALAGLAAEGESAAGIAWRLGEEVLALAQVKAGMERGRRAEQLYPEHRIFRPAQPRCERALRRYSRQQLRAAAVRIARAERAAKGAGEGDPWDQLLGAGLELADGSGT